MTKQLTYIQMLEEVTDKQTSLGIKLAELQGQQLMLTSKLLFAFDKKQRKEIMGENKKLDKQINAVVKALEKINKISAKLQKMM